MRQRAAIFPRGLLRHTAEVRSRQALQIGALHTIATQELVLESDGLRYLVRVRRDPDGRTLAPGGAWDEGSVKGGAETDPFLPYDNDLFVTDVTHTHICLLNKFNVIIPHLLIVTRRFEHQETLLQHADFEALALCMTEFPSLGFYNAGIRAGASQPHKHLQVVPLPLAKEVPDVPIAPLLPDVQEGSVGIVPSLPFAHAFVRLEPRLLDQPLRFASTIRRHYNSMLEATGIKAVVMAGKTRQSGSYNLLVTRLWMMLVPRREENFGPLSVNALGFAGSFFVKNDRELHMLRDAGPLAVLRRVAMPAK